MKRSTHGGESSSRSSQEAEFHLGYLYRTIEEHVNAFAAQAGCPYSVTDVAVRMGRLLQDKAIREQLRDSELVSEVRQNGQGSGLRRAAGAEAAFHVRAFGDSPLKPKRRLSKKALRAISKAQKARWAKFHAGDKSKSARAKTVITPKMRKSQSYAKAQSAFWAAMTPKQRSAEMIRRRAVSAAKRAEAEKKSSEAAA